LRVQAAAQADAGCLVSGAHVSRHLRTGAVRFIGTDPGRPVRHPRPQQALGSPGTSARAYFAACGALFGIQDESTELRLTSTDDIGQRTVVRLQQMKSEIPVLAGELIVNFDRAHDIISVVAKTIPSGSVNTNPAISSAVAAQMALNEAIKLYGNVGGLTASIP